MDRTIESIISVYFELYDTFSVATLLESKCAGWELKLCQNFVRLMMKYAEYISYLSKNARKYDSIVHIGVLIMLTLCFFQGTRSVIMESRREI